MQDRTIRRYRRDDAGARARALKPLRPAVPRRTESRVRRRAGPDRRRPALSVGRARRGAQLPVSPMNRLARNAFPIGLAAAGFTLAVGFPTGDPDTYWHLASGQWMLDHRAILRTDIFSSTVSGQPYSVGEVVGDSLS